MSAVRADIHRQRNLDESRANYQGVLLARFAAVVGAQRAVKAGEIGARHALRQALIDVASAAELAASGLLTSPIGDE